MNTSTSKTRLHRVTCHALATLLVWSSSVGSANAALTALADQPIRTTTNVQANVLLTLSVEYPTAVSNAHIGNFSGSTRYIGYFDPKKCYQYNTTAQYFEPRGLVVNGTTGTLNFSCSPSGSGWSGSFLNWATMQTIDTFRWAMTGGQRVVDTPTAFSGSQVELTVLQRAYASGQGGTGNFPDKTLASASVASFVRTGDVPSLSGNLTVYNQGQGDSFRVTGANGGDRTFKARVRVCQPNYLEDNCQAYPDPAGVNATIYKPVGLIQKNAVTMRFGAFGYLNDSSVQRDGGVLRAPMRDVMSTTAPELYPTGAFVVNALATDPLKIANTHAGEELIGSGVIQYLNGFGNYGNTYKTYDPVGEMYAEAIKYYKNLAPTPSYAALSSTTTTRRTQMDGFPVFTTWNDPITNWCQKNFIVGIGDVNTHADKNLNGNPAPSGNEPTPRPAVGVDTTVNVHTWTNTVGALEGMGAIAGLDNINGCCSNNGYYMAGLAYYAHTQDLRDLPGRQTVQTYWVDVLEFQNYKHRNQYWLAAKYGGFKDANPANFQFDAADIWNADGRTQGGNPLPDNYYVASNPDRMVEGLTAAFSSIRSMIGSSTMAEFSLSNVSATAGSKYFSTTYDSTNWTGKLTASSIAGFNADDSLNTTTLWEFGSRLDAQAAGTGWNTGRSIVTFNGTAGAPFRFTNLTAGQLSTLGSTDTERQNLINYLRGAKANEATSTGVGGLYRYRASLLGDIVNSQPVFVGKSEHSYSDVFNPGYAAFVQTNRTRAETVYAGSNSGMLHAINVATGNERWAYVPSFLFAGASATPSTPAGTPSIDGLAALANKTFAHRYFVDATPVTRDVDFARVANTSGALPTVAATTFNWKTVLVGGLGKGGRGYYALDVTDGAMTGETNVAGKVLWEFTDPDMGYTYGKPLIVKTKQWGWVALLTSGYNNVHAPFVVGNPDYRGKGILYVVNVRTGALLAKIPTTVGSVSDPAGLAHISGFTRDYGDYTVESVYGGDLKGNLWRFDLTKTATFASTPAPTNPNSYVPSNAAAIALQFAQLTDTAGAAQPVTTAPITHYDPRSQKRWVFVGTGKMLDSSDATLNQTNHYYAIRDGYLNAPYTATTLPTGASFPLQRSQLQAINNTSLTTGASATQALESFGWYINFGAAGVDPNYSAERVIAESDLGRGYIAFATTIPGNDPCQPEGKSRFYAVNLATAKSVLTSNNTNVSYINTAGATGARIVTVGLKQRIVGGGAGDGVGGPSGCSGGLSGAGCGGGIGGAIGSPSPMNVLNWRVIDD